MIKEMRDLMNKGKKIYGMKSGYVGFLMNELVIEKMKERIMEEKMEKIRKIVMVEEKEDEKNVEELEINEV